MPAYSAMTKYRTLAAGLALVVGLSVVSAPAMRAAADTLPDRLSDEQFWELSERLSEPNGYFRSDNLLSNEIWLQYTIPDLLKRTKPGGVYLGVGPEQNFTYIAAMRPKIVFITDVRRGNLWTHLMYKALFELSADRAEFVSRLFTKPRPSGLSTDSTARQIFDAYWETDTSAAEVFKKNSQEIIDHLTKTRKLPLGDADRRGIIDDVYYFFYWYGPSITYNSSSRGFSGNFTNYYELMTATDGDGQARSFLANEDNFRFIKGLHQKNLIVPVVGNFAGPRALRAVGEYVREHDATVSAFYLSNVEQYLEQDGIWHTFCANVATLPLDDQSTFIRSHRGNGGGRSGGLVNSLGNMRSETRGCGVPAR